MNTKEVTVKKEEKLAALLAEAERHPMMRALLAEKAAETSARRQEVKLKIEGLRKEEADIIPKLQADRQEKELKYQKAKEALQTASDEFRGAYLALSTESNRISHEIGQQGQVLIETADPAIDEAITFFREKLDWLRTPGRINRIGRADTRNLFTWKKTTTEENNVQAVRDALAYCQAAILELERMKLLPELDLARIERMKVKVPDIEVYTEYTGEKPMEHQH